MPSQFKTPSRTSKPSVQTVRAFGSEISSEALSRAYRRVGRNGATYLGLSTSLAMFMMILVKILLSGVERVWKALLSSGTMMARALHSI